MYAFVLHILYIHNMCMTHNKYFVVRLFRLPLSCLVYLWFCIPSVIARQRVLTKKENVVSLLQWGFCFSSVGPLSHTLGHIPFGPAWVNHSHQDCTEMFFFFYCGNSLTNKSPCLCICRFRGGMRKNYSAIPQKGLGWNCISSGGGDGKW